MKKHLFSKILLAALLLLAMSAAASAEAGDIVEWLEERGHRMIEMPPRPKYEGYKMYAELVGNKMTYYPKQGITFFEVLQVREVPDKDILMALGKYSLMVWQFKKYDDGHLRTRWMTSETLGKDFQRYQRGGYTGYSESARLKNDGWIEAGTDSPMAFLAAAGFQYMEEFDGVMETGDYLETKDEFDKKR